MAGNIRFHNKFHAYTHYTDPVPGIPDSAMDPIASKEFPFLGNMYVAGCLSARGWLDDDGECKRFLWDPDPLDCRPVQICGDHMQGALHYSHVDYYKLPNFSPENLEIDFKVDTFKTIVCDSDMYHIMPVSLSAGCVTSTRFINPSANGTVSLAFHPWLRWLNPRPCILSAGEQAILSMTSFSTMLSDVTCIWKEEVFDHETPYIDYSPTISFHNEYLYYKIDTCAPVVFNFVLNDTVDVARIDMNGHPVLISNINNDLIWDDVSMPTLTSGPFSATIVPGVAELFNTFPDRAAGKKVTDVTYARDLLDKTNRINLNGAYSKDYNDCQYDIKYTGNGSILFTVSVAGAVSFPGGPGPQPRKMGKIIVGQSGLQLVNGDYKHNLTYHNNYVGDPGLERTVVSDRIWTKLVRPHDPAYRVGFDRYYTIERHQRARVSFWILKDPYGNVLYRNSHTNYSNNENYPLQNGWEPAGSDAGGTVVRIYLQDEVALTYDGVSYTPGSRYYITDEYVPLKYSGDFYGLCFAEWETYFSPSTSDIDAFIVPENTAPTDPPDPIAAIAIPGADVNVSGPTIVITNATNEAMNPWSSRYYVGQPVRLYTVGTNKLPDVYNNDVTHSSLKSTNTPGYENGGTYVVVEKRISTVKDSSNAALTVRLSCY